MCCILQQRLSICQCRMRQPPASHHDQQRNFMVKIKTHTYNLKKRKIILEWEAEQPELVRYYVIYKSDEIANPKEILAVTANTSIILKLKSLDIDPSSLTITAVDRYRKESQPIRLIDFQE